MFVRTGNIEQFDFQKAYGHPGGPIILGTIFINELTHTPYRTSLIIFLTLFNALLITGISFFCYLLKKGSIWFVLVFCILSMNRLFVYASPPSAVVALLITLLAVITIYMLENRDKIKLPYIVLWSVVAGLTISTRADIGIFMSAIFFVSIFFRLGWQKILTIPIFVLLTFFLTDPFMWSMPIQHIADILGKAIYHYSSFNLPEHLSFVRIANISYLMFISALISLTLLIKRKSSFPIPNYFIYTLLLITTVLYALFLTSSYQAERYFLPIVFIWQIFLPVFLFSLLPKVDTSLPTGLDDPSLKKKILVAFVFLVFFAIM